MVAKLKILGIADSLAHPDGGALAKVGDTITVAVSITDRSKSKGGTFRITHGGIAGDTFAFDGRIGTGEAKKLFQKKAKQAPNNYTGQDVFTFSIPITAAAALADVVLVAVTQCEVLAPDAPVQMTTVATQQEVADLMPTFLSVAPPIRMGVARGGNQGLAGQAANALQSRVQFHAALFFLDPEGNERPLPDGAPLVGIVGRQRRQFCETAVSRRAVAFSALATDMVLTHQVITLRVGDTADNALLCELPGAPSKTQTWGPLPPPSDPTGTLPNRYLTLPRMAELVQMECEVTNDDGRYDAATGLFSLAKDGRPTSLGSQGSPVKIVLKPKWQFLRFEYFDRYFGVSDHGGNNMVMPAVTLEGHDTIPGIPSPPAHTKSNWWLDPASDGKIVQCLPWFVQKTVDGTARAKPDIQTEIVFRLPSKTCVKSVSATVRNRVIATTQELEPGHDRLKFYDLPRFWKARNYYGAISTTADEFGWYQDIATKPTAVDRPIVFCLDDIVLTDSDGKMLDTWTHDERLAIFANTFDDTTADCTKEGLYKPDTGGNAPWLSEKPADGSPESGWNYLRALPKWARLIVAGGNLYDVFDKRSVVGSALGGDETVGARAAVRWVDATDEFPGILAYVRDPNPPNEYIAAPNNKPEAGRLLHPNLPPRTDKASFSIQPFYEQHYMERFGTYDVASSSGIGRVDLALMRCCDVTNRANAGSEREVAVHLYFEKTSFEFADAPPAGEDAFKVAYQRNVLDRWNGISPAHGRARLIPKDATKRVEVDVLTFLQVTEDAVAHHKVTIKEGADARDWRQGQNGTGATAVGNEADSGTTNGFTTAHEHGHERALPDEYNERWKDSTSFGQPSFYSTLPGDPFEMDGRTVEFQEMGAPMMNGNHLLHNRYFWQSAEWTRRVLGYPLKVKFNGCDEYEVPPHADPQRHYGFWPLDARLDQTLAAVPPVTANRAKLNGYLYALGKDKFATQTLKDKEGGGATDYDGILLITVLLKVTAPSGDEASCKSFTQALARVCRKFGSRKLNHKFYLTGTAAQGAPHEWTFTRCLLHFSPRVLVSAKDLVTRAQFLASIAPFGDFPESDIFANALTAYHGVPWNPLGPKQNAITTLKARVVDPYRAVDGDWAVASAAIVAPPPPPPPPVDPTADPPEDAPEPPPPPRPAEFTTIDTKLADLAPFTFYDFDERKALLKEIVDLADGFASANPISPYAASALALKDRAETGVKAVEVGLKMAWIKQYAGSISADRTKHEAVVVEIETAHPPHFIVHCQLGDSAPPKWKVNPAVVEMPKKNPWLNPLDASAKTDPRVVTAGNNLDAYHGKSSADYAGRLAALTALETPADAGDMTVPEEDWATASVIEGKSRPMQFMRVDSRLRAAVAAGATEFKKRADEMSSAITLLDEVISGKRSNATKNPARALKSRLQTARAANLAMVALRALEAKAKARAAALQLEAASREVTLTAPDADGFEDALLEVFPSMLGVYKAASEIAAADLQPFVDTLGLTNPVVHAI